MYSVAFMLCTGVSTLIGGVKGCSLGLMHTQKAYHLTFGLRLIYSASGQLGNAYCK